MNRTLKSNVCLLGTAIIWGFAFVAQRDSMDTIGPFMYSAIRMLLGSLTLVPIFLIGDRIRAKKHPDERSIEEKKASMKTLFTGGIIAGLVIFFAANLQQVGLVSTDAGKTAFITTLYILLVPMFGLFLKHKANRNNWIGAVIGAAGLYFLCVTTELTIARGDFLVFIGAFCWAFHILVLDHFAPKVDVSKLICIQFLVSGIISLIIAFIVEDGNTVSGIIQCAPSLLYTGIMSSAVAFTLQGLGQKHANPTTASIILSTESLFGAVSGFLVLHEMMTGRELLGCALMLAAVIIAQLPTKEERAAETTQQQD